MRAEHALFACPICFHSKKKDLNRLIPIFGKKIGMDRAQLESDFGPPIFHSNFGKRIWVDTGWLFFFFLFLPFFLFFSNQLKPNFGRGKKKLNQRYQKLCIKMTMIFSRT